MDSHLRLSRVSLSKLPSFLSGSIELIASLVFTGWFLRSHSLYALATWFAARAVWYVILISVTRFTPVLSKICHWFALMVFHIGFLLLLLITDQTSSFGVLSWGWYLLLAGGTLLPSLSFFAIPRRSSELVFMARPHMRIGIAMLVFGLGGVWAGESAAITFNLYQPTWWWIFGVGASFLSALAAGIGWWWYVRESLRSIFRLSLFMFWCMAQLALVLSLWPLGFLFTGLVAAWIWYVLWLTIRYYLSEDGITWPRHAYFLVGHGCALAIMLSIVVRWR